MPDQFFNLPVNAVEVFSQRGLLPEFRVFVATKMVTPGRFSTTGAHFTALCELLGLQPRTVKKHLNTLVRLKVAGYSKKAKVYYIRSWVQLAERKFINGPYCAKISTENIKKNFADFCFSVVVSTSVIKHKTHYRLLKRDSGKERLSETGCNPELVSYYEKKDSSGTQPAEDTSRSGNVTVPMFFGLSNHSAGKLFDRSKQWASLHKKESAKQGFIEYNHVFKIVATLDGGHESYRNMLNESSEEPGRMRICKTEDKKIVVLEQLHDEIVPKIVFRQHRFIDNLKELRKNKNNSDLDKRRYICAVKAKRKTSPMVIDQFLDERKYWNIENRLYSNNYKYIHDMFSLYTVNQVSC